MENKIYINHRGTIFNPEPIEEIQWSTRLYGAGELKFKVLKDNVMDFKEGDQVTFYRNNVPIFKGYVFSKERHKNSPITVLCYDQLRYFKNKDTYTYSNITASGLLKMIASDYNLTTGDIANTAYVLPPRIEDNSTLFDIMYNALESTEKYNRQKYVLYDDFGQLTLKPYEDMLLPVWVDESTAEEYDYTSTIDDETYNRIKLAYDNGDSGQREVHVFNDTLNQSKWGTLQYYEKLDKALSAADLKVKADALLKYYNLKKRELTIKSVFGDIRVRAGTLVSVGMRLGDMDLSNYMGVEKAKHTFSDGIHTMDLYLAGVRGEFHA